MPRRIPRPRPRALVGAVTLALAGSTLTAATVPATAELPRARSSATLQAAPAAPGSAGIGDPYFPRYGNGGYRVRHYDVDVTFDPATERLRGRTVIAGRTTQRLSRFNLDLVLRASRVLVNGVRARHSRTAHELVVTPRRPVAAGRRLRVVVRYAGVPSRHRALGVRPWITTRDGAVAVGEPEIAAWWFPSNDHPSDKATFDITLRVPRGTEAVSNGRLLGHRNVRGRSIWRWRENDPMATYLAFAAIGQYDIVRGRAGGRPYLYAFSQGLRNQRPARRSIRATPRITSWLQRTWGARYPYDEIGGVVLGKWIGFALENQTRPVYSRAFFEFGQDKGVVVHEMAHQWFGNKVALRRWRHMWLNEGFATYSEWLWRAHARNVPASRTFRQAFRFYGPRSRFWDLRIGAPGPKRLFHSAVYERGAMTAHALRTKMGSRAFFRLVRTWLRRDRTVTSDDFESLAARVHGSGLGRFFDTWLRAPRRPRPTPQNGFPRNF
jgi:aminopeptidase N